EDGIRDPLVTGVQTCALPIFLLLAPLFLGFEIWQLVLCERYLGIKQIARGADPRALGLGEITAFFWSLLIIFYGLWMLLLLALRSEERRVGKVGSGGHRED